MLRKDTWERVNTGKQLSSQTYSAVQLVGVDGSPLKIHGCATVDLRLKGHSLFTDITVVSSLTAEANVGLEFLREQQAHIDLPKQQIHLVSLGISLPLEAPSRLPEVISRIAVQAVEKLKDTTSV